MQRELTTILEVQVTCGCKVKFIVRMLAANIRKHFGPEQASISDQMTFRNSDVQA